MAPKSNKKVTEQSSERVTPKSGEKGTERTGEKTSDVQPLTLSTDLLWALTRSSNSFLVHRKHGNVMLSRDPLNIANVHSRKYSGIVNENAIGITAGNDNSIVVRQTRSKFANKPAKLIIETVLSRHTASRKIYKVLARLTAKSGYRPDLRAHAVARGSAIRKSRKERKSLPPTKLRGARAKQAAVEKK